MGSKRRNISKISVGLWLAGVLFTLLRGIDRNPWGVGIWDLDLLVLLTGYLFLSMGSIQAAVFALLQGLFTDVLSGGPTGLSALIDFGVFWFIYLGSLFFNLQTVKGQIIVVSSAVVTKLVMWEGAILFFYGEVMVSSAMVCQSVVAVIGTGLVAPWLYALLDRLRGDISGEEDAPVLEEMERRP